MTLKKVLLAFVFAVSIWTADAQNIQLHYDFGRAIYKEDFPERPLLTSTVEMFKPDKWGNTYFFVDMDYRSKGVAMAYWEIARELKFWDAPLSVHVEYNGGLEFIKNAYLYGATYTWNSADFSAGYTLSAMYKYIQKLETPHNFQITGTWYIHFAKNNMCTFTGFADFWREKSSLMHRGKISEGNYIFLSEPQFWLHLNKMKGVDEHFKLSIGSEVKLRNNFAAQKGFYAIPTAAIRWDF